MVFKVMSAYSIELIALAAGVFLLMKAGKEQVTGKIVSKVLAWFIVAASILLMVFTTLYSFSYCQAGKFSPYERGGKMHHKKGRGMGEGGGMEKMGGKKGPPMMHMMMQGPGEGEEEEE
jgi:hypothetical protein